MNIFEGARRIAKLTAALIVVGFGFAIIYDSPSPVSVSYLIAGVAKPPARVEQCEVGDVSQTKEITSKSGTKVYVNLCFKSSFKLQSYLEGEKRGLLSADQQALLDEARSRGLITPNSKAKNTHAVTATFADGTMHVYAGVPSDVTPDVVQARAEKEFKKKVVHLDGHRGRKIMDWEPAQDVQKNDKGERKANIDGTWVAITRAQKNADGEYRVMRAEPAVAPSVGAVAGGAHAVGQSDLAIAIPIVLDAFQIPKADEGYITRLEWFQRAQSAGLYLLGMFASLAGFWLFVWTVGWIVRGFKGIPQGRDSGG